MRFFSFSLLIGGGAVLGHLYLYRLVRHLLPDRRARRAGAGFLLLMTVLLVLRGPIRDIGPAVERAYEVITYSWIAFALCTVVALSFGDAVRLVIASARFIRPSKEPRGAPSEQAVDPARRGFLTRSIPLGVVAGGTLTAGYGSLRAFTAPEVTELELALPKLPANLEGLTIAQLTDIHVGPFLGQSFIDALVSEVDALRADVVVVTGDVVDGDVRDLGDAVGRLGRIRSRYGVYVVTGNHEYYSGVEPWTELFDRAGMHVLRNRRVEIGDAGGSIDLVGVDDWGGASRGAQGYDLEAALADRDPDRAAVLLAHQPVNFEEAVERGIGLQISGHTHGGQLFPFTELVGLRYPYHRGLYRHRDAHIYVSRGCGFWGPPARVGSAPEIVKVTLVGRS